MSCAKISVLVITGCAAVLASGGAAPGSARAWEEEQARKSLEIDSSSLQEPRPANEFLFGQDQAWFPDWDLKTDRSPSGPLPLKSFQRHQPRFQGLFDDKGWLSEVRFIDGYGSVRWTRVFVYNVPPEVNAWNLSRRRAKAQAKVDSVKAAKAAAVRAAVADSLAALKSDSTAATDSSASAAVPVAAAGVTVDTAVRALPMVQIPSVADAGLPPITWKADFYTRDGEPIDLDSVKQKLRNLGQSFEPGARHMDVHDALGDALEIFALPGGGDEWIYYDGSREFRYRFDGNGRLELKAAAKP